MLRYSDFIFDVEMAWKPIGSRIILYAEVQALFRGNPILCYKASPGGIVKTDKVIFQVSIFE